MILAAVFSASCCLGALVFTSGARISLRPDTEITVLGFVREHVFGRAAKSVTSFDSRDANFDADLMILGQTAADFNRERLRTAAFAVLVVGFSILLMTGVVFLTLALSLVVALIMLVVTRRILGQKAETARQEQVVVLSRYMEVAAAAVSSGLDSQTALIEVSHYGTREDLGPMAEAVEIAARTRGRLSDSYQELGRDLRLPGMVELGDALEQAQEVGAPIERVLRDRAVVMEERRVAKARGEAESKSQQMTLPLFLLSFGFILFIIFPGIAGFSDTNVTESEEVRENQSAPK